MITCGCYVGSIFRHENRKLRLPSGLRPHDFNLVFEGYAILRHWEKDRNFIIENIRRPEDFEKVTQKLTEDFLEQTRFLFLPPEVQKSVSTTVVRKILEANRE